MIRCLHEDSVASSDDVHANGLHLPRLAFVHWVGTGEAN